MDVLRFVPLLVLLVPLAGAQQGLVEVVPALPYESRIIAAWASLDGQSQVGAAVAFGAVFGDSAARTTEADVVVPVTERMNLTGFRVMAGAASCGNLVAGESILVILRRNLTNTPLQGNCTSGAAAGSQTVDNDVLQVFPGDRLSISYQVQGSLLTRNPRLGMSLIGIINQSTEPIMEEVSLSVFEETLGLTSNEFIAVMGLYFALLFFWSRTAVFEVQLICFLMMLVLTILAVVLFVSAGLAWPLLLLALLFIGTAVLMIVNSILGRKKGSDS